MTTIKIAVKNKRDAGLLIRILRKMSFVEHIEEIEKETVKPNQFENLQSFLASGIKANLFNDITDPVAWQKQIRNEWE